MIKKLLFTVALFVTTMSFGQLTIDFEETAPVYTIGHQGAANTSATIESNPSGTTGNDTGANVLKYTINSNIGFWAYPFIDLKTGGTQVNTTLGKFFNLKFISPIENGSIYFYPWISGKKQPAIIANFTGASATTWQTIEFDCTSSIEGYLSRMDFEFHTGTELIAGDVYYIDDIAQTTASTLGVKNYELLKIGIYPNPTTNTLTIQDKDQEIKSVRIFDVTGKQVLKVENKTTVDVSTLTKGVYLIKTDNGKLAKFIKE